MIDSTRDLHDTYTAALDDPYYAAWVQRAKTFGSIKLDGLYVNFDDSGVKEPNSVVDEVTAARCLAYATGEVQRLHVAKIVQSSQSPLASSVQ